MWFRRKTKTAGQLPADEQPQPHPQAMRIYEIKRAIEAGFWSCNGGKVAGAFDVVAQILAEQEARIDALESSHDA